MVIHSNNSKRRPTRRQREAGLLMTDIAVAIAFLTIAVIPLAYSYTKERQYLRACYQRAIAMEIVDGEMEILLAGEWKSYTNGVHNITSKLRAATNMQPGTLQLTLNSRHLHLQWLPSEHSQGGPISREADVR